jgi:hypothetical protein
MDVSEAKRLKGLEDENARLKRFLDAGRCDEGNEVNHKRLFRIYREERLQGLLSGCMDQITDTQKVGHSPFRGHSSEQ